MIYFDTHCDTLLHLTSHEVSLAENNLQLDLKRLRGLGQAVQVFAACVSPACSQGDAARRAFVLIDRYWREIERWPGLVAHCNTGSDIERALREGKVAALLSIEGGEALVGDLSALRIYYRLGVRSLCLTHNARNELADGASFSDTGGGLTSLGRSVVDEMNRLGMLIDVSHLAVRGFWDVIEATSQPIIASHSDSRTLCDHVRNLTDSQLLAIRDHGGVVGINYYPLFLNHDGRATLTDIIRHLEYMVALMGVDHVGLGSDFDGIPCWPEDVCDVTDVTKIIEALTRLNYSREDIEKIAGGNFLRLTGTMGVTAAPRKLTNR